MLDKYEWATYVYVYYSYVYMLCIMCTVYSVHSVHSSVYSVLVRTSVLVPRTRTHALPGTSTVLVYILD